jgi:hypothetical protein
VLTLERFKNAPISEFRKQAMRQARAVLDAYGVARRKARAVEAEGNPSLRQARERGPEQAERDTRERPEHDGREATPDEDHSDPEPSPPVGIARGGPDGLPFVLYAEDLAQVFRESVATARRKLRAGDYGPRFRNGRRWAVLASALHEHLESVSERPRRAARRRYRRTAPNKRTREWKRRLEAARQRRNGRPRA